MSAPDEPNSGLEALMTELARPDAPAEAFGAFYRMLLDARLSIATPGAVAGGKLKPGAAQAGEDGLPVSFIATTDPSGGKAMMAFTGRKALLNWRPAGCDTVELGMRDLCRLALDSGCSSVVVNPRGPAGGILPGSDLKLLAEGKAPERRAPEVLPRNIELRAPAAPPPAWLLEILKDQAKKSPRVRAAFVAEAALEGGPRPLLVLRVAKGAPAAEVVPPFIDGLRARLKPGQVPPDAIVVEHGSDLDRSAQKVGVEAFRQ
jgi:hypothetical protein